MLNETSVLWDTVLMVVSNQLSWNSFSAKLRISDRSWTFLVSNFIVQKFEEMILQKHQILTHKGELVGHVEITRILWNNKNIVLKTVVEIGLKNIRQRWQIYENRFFKSSENRLNEFYSMNIWKGKYLGKTGKFAKILNVYQNLQIFVFSDIRVMNKFFEILPLCIF